MAITLKKGQGVSLRKNEHDLSMVTIGLGWDLLTAKGESNYDLDVVAFLCGNDGKVHDLGLVQEGKWTLKNGDIIFFGNLRHHSGQIWLTGDNRTGTGHGDDEQIIVKLNDLPSQYGKVVFIVQIYDGTQKGQSFGQVKKAFIRAVDGNGEEMVRFDLSGGSQYADCRSMLFAELLRETGGWNFHAIGTPAAADTLVYWLKQYL